jgi:hypothetical protein
VPRANRCLGTPERARRSPGMEYIMLHVTRDRPALALLALVVSNRTAQEDEQHGAGWHSEDLNVRIGWISTPTTGSNCRCHARCWVACVCLSSTMQRQWSCPLRDSSSYWVATTVPSSSALVCSQLTSE